jgi:hypothetical protein
MVGHVFRRVERQAVRLADPVPTPTQAEHRVGNQVEVSDPNRGFPSCPRSRQFRGGESQIAALKGPESGGWYQSSGGLRSARVG